MRRLCPFVCPVTAFCLAILSGAVSVPAEVDTDGAEPVSLSSFDPQVKGLLAKMTLEEKVGQMTQPDQESIRDLSDIQTYFVGSVLSGGNSDPRAGNSVEAWSDRYDQLQEQALKTRLGIPILYGIDAVHGHNNVLNAVVFPHNIGMGCIQDVDLIERAARVTAEEVRATGTQWTFGPCVTVPRDERWGRTYEGYSEDPDVVTPRGAAAVRGMQGTDLSNPLAILACAKHYVGDGGTTAVTGGGRGGGAFGGFGAVGGARGGGGGIRARLDQGNTQVDEATLRRIHLAPYVAAIEAGVGSIMPSYSSWNGVKCSGSKQLMTDILKEELGFEGFLISDYNAIDQITGNYKEAIGISINAGMDMAMVPSRYAEYHRLLVELVNEGTVPMSRIDDAVTRILRVKFAMGMMDKGRSQLTDRELHKTFGSPEHREVGREAVRRSLVLLKNEHNTLPLAKDAAKVYVGGRSADNIGDQCGGWTIQWQGRSGNVTTGGTTILAAVQQAVSDHTEVVTSPDGTGAEDADVAVVIIGERPYAEGMGDRGDLSFDQVDVQAVANAKATGLPVVVILLSGRPMILGDVLEQADAVIAAWLPGTEGQGVADVLFGDYNPTGRLSFTWPRSMDQIPINVGDEEYDPLFEIGYGLSY